MNAKKFALVGGIVMLAIGVLAFIPALSSHQGLPPLYNETSYGYFLGIFAMNIFNKLALVILGLMGIAVSDARANSFLTPVQYSKLVFIVMAALAVLGLIPATSTLFGYWPLYGAEVIFHAVWAGLGAYFGYSLSARRTKSGYA